MRRSTLIRSAALAALSLPLILGFQGSVNAQQPYPNRPIKLIVPYPPGASTDSMARAFAEELAKELKNPVVIENKPGAGTAIGALAVKSQPADGHTLLFQTEGLFVAKLSNPSLAYEFRDFEVITPLSKTPYALVVPAQNQIKTLDDLKAHAAKKNNELDFGTLGAGSVSQYPVLSHILSEQLGIKEKMIPYKGGMEALTAVMAGDIDAFYSTVSLAHSQKENAKIHILALTSDGNPNPFFPEVKSFKELGIQGMTFHSSYGIAMRSDTPETIKTQLKQVSRRISDSEALKRMRRQIGIEDFPGTLAEYNAEQQKTVQMLQNFSGETK